MHGTLPQLAAASHPGMVHLLQGALGLYLAALLLLPFRPSLARGALWAGVVAHLLGMAWRGLVIDFFPLTNKSESFSSFGLAVALVTLGAWRRERLFAGPMLGLSCLALTGTFVLGLDMGYPPPLMRTPWYPLHVPASFLAYGAWCGAAATALVWLQGRDRQDLDRMDRLVLAGFALWCFSMVCGGFWGVVAWGSYFLWDPKVMWSVILWFYYATFIHVRLTPSLRGRPWVRPALALVGFWLVLVTWIGTSFLFGANSHAWR